jgi:hypothetical protein
MEEGGENKKGVDDGFMDGAMVGRTRGLMRGIRVT